LIVEYHPVQILESFECVMSKWTIEYVKVLWANHMGLEATL
jgi:hypothetical protein